MLANVPCPFGGKVGRSWWQWDAVVVGCRHDEFIVQGSCCLTQLTQHHVTDATVLDAGFPCFADPLLAQRVVGRKEFGTSVDGRYWHWFDAF